MPKFCDAAVLDIGSGGITAVAGSRNSRGVFNVMGYGSCPYSGFSGGKWFDVPDLRRAVSKVLKTVRAESGVRIKKLYIGVPSEFLAVVVKEIVSSKPRSSRITDADITGLFEQGDTYASHSRYTAIGKSAIYYTLDDKSRRYIEVRGLEAYRVRGMLSYILCERGFTSLFESIARENGLREIEYVSSIWAECVSLFSEEKRFRRQLLADVGYITSSVAVVQGDGLVHLSSFSLGGGHIASDISLMFEIPFSAAAEVKEKVDLSLDFTEDSFYETADGKYRLSAIDVNEIVKSRLDTIAEFMKESLASSRLDYDFRCPLYLTGGGITGVRGARDYLSASLGSRIEIVSPDVPRYSKPVCAAPISLFDVASDMAVREMSGLDRIKRKLFSRTGG